MATQVTIKLNTGASIPAVGFGTVCTPEYYDDFKLALKGALLDAKYLHIDTAWYYHTEHLIGEVLSELFESGQLKREDLFITTKVWPCNWSKPLESLNKSLKDLRLDYVDLFLQHWPLCFDESSGEEVPKDANGDVVFAKNADFLDTWKKLIEIYKNTDKVKAIGVSNYTIEYLERLLKETDVVPAVNQVELHPHLPQVKLVNFCKSKGIVIEAYSPLGSTGAPNLKIPLVIELAKKYNATPADILINYHVSSGRVVLPRSHNIERVKKGYPRVDISKEDLAALDKYGIENPERFIQDSWGRSIGFEYWN